MNKWTKIVLLGFMIWIIKFIVGSLVFLVFTNAEGKPSLGIVWNFSIIEFSIVIGLSLALFLFYRDKGQVYKRTALGAGIIWYLIILLMDLISVVGLLGLELTEFIPSILSDSMVLIIPIVVGHLLFESKH